MPKLLRITTVPLSLHKLLDGQARYMSQNGLEVMLCSAAGESIDLIKNAEGVAHTIVPFTRKISPIKDLVALFKTIRLIRNFKPDIVHANTPKACLIGMLAARFCGVKVRMSNVDGLPYVEAQGVKRWVLGWTEKITFWAASIVLPNSHEMTKMILDFGFTTNQKMTVLGDGSSNGINLDYFNPLNTPQHIKDQLKEQLGISDASFVFLFVGRVVKDKGIKELAQAFKRAYELYPIAQLVVVGPLEQELDPITEEELDFLNHHPGVSWVGYQEDIRPYLGISDLFLFPSYREGFPNVVMQAGAYHLPCIVSNINGCNEIIVDGQNGYIVPSKDSEQLFERMVQLLNEPQLLNRMKASSRSMIADRYDQKLFYKLLLEEYQKQLSRV